MINWRKVSIYALALFAAQFTIGFIEGLLLPQRANPPLSPQVIASVTVSFLVCAAIFTHLAVQQIPRTLEHGTFALLGQVLIGALMTLVAPSWVANFNAANVGVELPVLVIALVAGTSLGTRIRKYYGPHADA